MVKMFGIRFLAHVKNSYAVTDANIALFFGHRHITRSGLHTFWQEKRGRGGHQGPERPEAPGSCRANHCQVCQQPKPEDRPGAAHPALPDRRSALYRTPAPPDSAVQVLLATYYLSLFLSAGIFFKMQCCHAIRGKNYATWPTKLFILTAIF